MSEHASRKMPWVVVLGDVLTYFVVTLIGFSSHDTLALGALARILATFIPFTAGWFLIAPWLGIFQASIIKDRTHLPRVLLAALLAAPIGAFLRGLWLGSPILPVFVLVMAGVSGLGMMIWRSILQFLIKGSASST